MKKYNWVYWPSWTFGLKESGTKERAKIDEKGQDPVKFYINKV